MIDIINHMKKNRKSGNCAALQLEFRETFCAYLRGS